MMIHSMVLDSLSQNPINCDLDAPQPHAYSGHPWPIRALKHEPVKIEAKGIRMKNLHQSALAEIKALLEATRLADVPEPPFAMQDSRSHKAKQAESERVVEPVICSLDGDIHWCRFALSQESMMLLHNEQPNAASYPLSLTSGLFFSEVMSPLNEHVNEYYQLVSGSLSIIKEALDERGRMAFEDIDEVGRRIQQLDASFARKKINKPQDDPHRCYGPNPEHPYSKIALCRTVVPVVVEGKVMPFLFEKFLISYSYLDENGKRKSTVTPVHSHPLNFETVYFTSYGPQSVATEQEFHLIFKNDRPLIMADGRIDPEFIRKAKTERLGSITLTPGEISRITPGSEPVMLPPFESDRFLKKADLISLTDGLFRPHQVTIHDDLNSDRETLYYALDNYLGPRGRVLFFSGDGGINLWSHSNWR
jgi:hypothetical protein